MSWQQRSAGRFAPGQDMRAALAELLREQRQHWPLFARGEQALQDLQRRPVTRQATSTDADAPIAQANAQLSAQVIVQANPRRKVSSAAKLDAKSIAARPCFLCEGNLPAEERGLLYDGRCFVVANPFPIVRGHLSIPYLQHQPQRLRGHIDDMLGLAASLPGHLVFYNGPRCGASAPDHLHFQACPRDEIIGLQALQNIRWPQANDDDSQVQHLALRWPARRALLLRSQRAQALSLALQRSLDLLAELLHEEDEAMVNVFAWQQDGGWTALIFPRQRHRPDCFYAEGEQQILVSPGALDMAGLMVVADSEHFLRIDDDKVCKIYAQVSLDGERFAQWIVTLKKSLTTQAP